MNSEELEQSLRSEFETHLNTVIADLRQESVEFQNKIHAEFDRHKAQFDEVFAAISAKFDSTPTLNEAFNSSVAEHLKLARDEGAKIAANAMVAAEKFDDKPAPAARYDAIRDAVNDISSKDSQSAILKTLVQYAGEFAPRGAFFIIKSGHFAGWKVFGTADDMEQAVRAIHFPTSQDTILGDAVNSLGSVEGHTGRHSQDSSFLTPLGFGEPARMMAFPLIARGRGVAVLYVDNGDGAGEINRDALETIIRVAGLTVELLASTQTAAEENRTMGAADFENARHDEEIPSTQGYAENSYTVPAVPVSEAGGFSFKESEPGEEYSYKPDVHATPAFDSPYRVTETESAREGERHFESTIPNVSQPASSQSLGQDAEVSGYSQPTQESVRHEETIPAYNYSFETPGAASGQPVNPAGTEDLAPTDPQYAQPAPEFGEVAPQFGQQATGYGQPPTESGGSAPGFGQPSSQFGQQADEYRPGSSEQGRSEPDLGRSVPEFGQPTPPFGHQAEQYGQGSEQRSKLAQEFGQPAPEFGQSSSQFGRQAEESHERTPEFGQPAESRSFSPFDAEPSAKASTFESPFDTAVEEYRPAAAASGTSYSPTPEPVVPAPAVSSPQARLSDRPVDLPIEVPDEERRLHNDARRFARLLVSEIKLYNEKKVIEGKQSHDLYDRLREAIDRSREMYDKRVQPPVASKFDYFHYELVNSLAEGDVQRLGSGYPGAKV